MRGRSLLLPVPEVGQGGGWTGVGVDGVSERTPVSLSAVVHPKEVAPVSGIEFDREAVGVSAKADWGDAEEFARIGSFMASIVTATSARDLPEGDNAGVSALRTALSECRNTMRWVVLEHGDACAVLGSGQESAIADFDSTEYQNTEDFRAVVARMEG